MTQICYIGINCVSPQADIPTGLGLGGEVMNINHGSVDTHGQQVYSSIWEYFGNFASGIQKKIYPAVLV